MKSCGFINTPWWWCAVCCRRASGSWGVWTRGEMANADFASVGAAVSAGKVTLLQLYFASFKDVYWRRKSWSIRSSQKVMGVFFQPLIVDVRTEDEFAAGRIPGAINIPLSEVWMRNFAFPSRYHSLYSSLISYSQHRSSLRSPSLKRSSWRHLGSANPGWPTSS